MRSIRLGQFLFAASFAGIGLLSLGSGDFALNWQPVPAGIPAREALAYASGLVLLAASVGMFVKRTAAVSSAVLFTNMVLWLLLLRLPRVAASPSTEAMWLGFGETLMQTTGAWILYASLRTPVNTRGIVIARMLFGAALIPVGLSHIVYLKTTADFIPAWIPAHTPLAYLTGVAHIAAGVAILLGIQWRLAANLEAVMLVLFGLLVWLPRVMSTPTSRLNATGLLITFAIAGASFALAGSLRPVPSADVHDEREAVPLVVARS